jgi:hypothetical protein
MEEIPLLLFITPLSTPNICLIIQAEITSP